MELRLEIEPGSDPIAGVLIAGDPPVAHQFTGWLQLTELITAAVGRTPDEDPPPEQRHEVR